MKTLIVYASKDGQTYKICHRLKTILSSNHHFVDLISIDHPIEQLSDYTKVIIASSIRYGKHDSRIIAYIDRHSKRLNQMKACFISVNLVARKAERSCAENNPYVQKFLKSIKWKPFVTGVFAGKLDYEKYSWLDKLLIQAIMIITKGPTDPRTKIEYTDWKAVDKFGQLLSNL